MKAKLEIACFNVESCYNAEMGGADRIEFCADFTEGGNYPKLIGFQRNKKENCSANFCDDSSEG